MKEMISFPLTISGLTAIKWQLRNILECIPISEEGGYPANKAKHYYLKQVIETMKTFKNILFPIDFSESSKKIIPYVITMAQAFQGRAASPLCRPGS